MSTSKMEISVVTPLKKSMTLMKTRRNLMRVVMKRLTLTPKKILQRVSKMNWGHRPIFYLEQGHGMGGLWGLIIACYFKRTVN